MSKWEDNKVEEREEFLVLADAVSFWVKEGKVGFFNVMTMGIAWMVMVDS